MRFTTVNFVVCEFYDNKNLLYNLFVPINRYKGSNYFTSSRYFFKLQPF